MKCLIQFAKDDQGQDLIEYALMAGFVAVAAGALMPSVSSSISKVFSKIQSLLANCGRLGFSSGRCLHFRCAALFRVAIGKRQPAGGTLW